MWHRGGDWIRREIVPSQGELLIGGLIVLMACVGWIVASALGMAFTAYRDAIIPTIVGVVVGLPVALWVSRLGESIDQDRKRLEARERRRVVLSVLRAELDGCLSELHGDRSIRPREVILPYLKSEAWHALSASGDLRLIGDPAVLGTIARAYHRIGTTTALEQDLMSFLIHTGPTRTWSSPTPADKLRDVLEDQDRHTIAAVEKAIEVIDGAEPDLDRLSVA